MKRKNITYTEDFTVENGIIIPVEATREVTRSHTKRYHNCLYLLARLNPCARNLMDYLVEHMDKNNVVSSNEHTRLSFREFIKYISNDKVKYSDSSVKKALASLTSTGLIRKLKRGAYKVNPDFFMKNGDENRDELLKIELEFIAGIDTKLKVIKENEMVNVLQPYLDKDEDN